MDLPEKNPDDPNVPHVRDGKMVFPVSRTAQVSSYLTDAGEALANAGDPRYLWRPMRKIYENDSLFGSLERGGETGNRRLRALRSSVIFSAVAFEAYVNAFLAEHLTPEQVDEIDFAPTMTKLKKGPKMRASIP